MVTDERNTEKRTAYSAQHGRPVRFYFISITQDPGGHVRNICGGGIRSFAIVTGWMKHIFVLFLSCAHFALCCQVLYVFASERKFRRDFRLNVWLRRVKDGYTVYRISLKFLSASKFKRCKKHSGIQVFLNILHRQRVISRGVEEFPREGPSESREPRGK